MSYLRWYLQSHEMNILLMVLAVGKLPELPLTLQTAAGKCVSGIMHEILRYTLMLTKQFKKKLHGLSPRANYTDRATAACRRSDCQLYADSEYHVVSVTDPYGRILGFLDRSRYFSIK
jgi:hypothetical protein